MTDKTQSLPRKVRVGGKLYSVEVAQALAR